MNILIAPDKFKGSLTAHQVASAISRGAKRFDENINCTILPLADGGEGSLQVIQNVLNLKQIQVKVKDPLGKTITSNYLQKGKEVYIELALSSGLQLLKTADHNPLLTSTMGTGQKICHAIENGAKVIHLFLGGSATNDAGIGISSALGYVFKDKKGKPLPTIGASLAQVENLELINPPIGLSEVLINCYVDVSNPFYGPTGAAFVFAKQKGANAEMINQLDRGLKSFAKLIYKKFNTNINVKGAGAAGGIPGGLKALFNIEIHSGIDFILETISFKEELKKADFVITGEGKYDIQSVQGKAVTGVKRIADTMNKECILLAGCIDIDKKDPTLTSYSYFDSVEKYASSQTDSINNASVYLEMMTASMLKSIT